jgi:hypothetical protein
LESGHLQGKWIIRMGVAWTWLSIASNAKFWYWKYTQLSRSSAREAFSLHLDIILVF